MGFRQNTVPVQETNVLYLQHEKSFIKCITNYHNIAILNILELGPLIKYVSRVSIEGYFLTCQKKVVAEATINKVVGALVDMSTRKENAIGRSLIYSEASTVIHYVKGYFSKNMEA